MIELELILDHTLREAKITRTDIRGISRLRPIVNARAAYCIVARKKTKRTLTDIGFEIRTNHTMVHYYINNLQDLEVVKELITKIGNQL